MSSRARSRVRDAICALERRYGTSAMMLTGTLPGGSERAVQAFRSLAGKVMERVGQWLRDTAPNAPYVFVWELQARGALHCHIAVASFNKKQLRALKRRWKRYWCRMLDSLSDVSGIDLYERTNGSTWAGNNAVVRAWAQHVRKSIARYLSKYLSKGGNSLGQLWTPYRLADFAPARWFSVARRCEQLIAQYSHGWHTGILTGEQAIDTFETVAAALTESHTLKFFYHGKVIEEDLTLIYYPTSLEPDAAQSLIESRFPTACEVSTIDEVSERWKALMLLAPIAIACGGSFKRGAPDLIAGSFLPLTP